MTMINWIKLCHIVIAYYMTIFIISINGKSILYGKSIIELNGNIKIPVFLPISWLIHDIHSAKMIGQKSDANDMMTSDMTPDMNGNFERQPSDDKQETSGTPHRITNRVSVTQHISEKPNKQDLTKKEEPTKGRPQTMKDPLLQTEDMMRYSLSSNFNTNKDSINLKTFPTKGLESNQQNFIAKQRLRDEIMYEPDVWPKEADPLFTTIEIYEVPGAGNYMESSSNRTAVHKAPDETIDKKDDKLKIRLKSTKNKESRSKLKATKVKQAKLRQPMASESKVIHSKVTQSGVKVLKNAKSNYFKNYRRTDKNKFNI